MPQRPTPPGRQSLMSRLGLERLEDRTLLSASAPLLDLRALTLTSNYDKDHILVRYQPGQTPVPLAGTTIGRAVEGASNLYKVQLGSGMSVSQAVQLYRLDARVQLAEPDFLLQTGAVATPPSNDTRSADQWALNNTGKGGGTVGSDLDIARAWKVTTGSAKTVVSIMDTGIDYDHPDLYLNIWLNQGEIPATRRGNLRDINSDGSITFRDLNDPLNKGTGKITDLNGNGFIDAGDVLSPMIKDASGRDTGRGGWADKVSNDKDAYIDDLCGWNYVSGNNKVLDDFGHGTQVAGVLGAVGNNAAGIAGINWSVQMMPIKFMNSSGAGSISDFIEGLEYAVSHGAKISNNSWTGATYSTPLLEAIQSARARGHIFVAAAGNFDSNNDASPTYPAGFKVDNVVAVTATDRSDKLASFANYGAKSVTLGAPGVDILSTSMGGGYGYNSGTSMATPHVAGVMALVWSAHPTWTYGQVIRQVTNTVDKVPSLAGKTITGGRVNAGAALAAGATATPAATPPRIVSAVQYGPSANTMNRVRVTFDRAMSVSTFAPVDVYLTNTKGQRIAVTSVKAVPGSGDKMFEIVFATQTVVGPYWMRIGPEVRDVKQVKMTTWSNTFRITAPAPKPPPTPTQVTTKTYTSSVQGKVTPGGRFVSLLTVSDPITIADLNVKINLTHPRLSDLVIHLQAPNGMDLILFNRMGGPTANLTNTIFDDQAAMSIVLGRAPFTGSFQPALPLASFTNQSAKGTWKLWVEDRGGKNTGTLLNWSLIIRPKV